MTSAPRSEEIAPAPRSRRRPARTLVIAVVAALALLAVGTVAGLLVPRTATSDSGLLPPTTASIQRGTLVGETLARGTLTYRSARALEAGRDGTVTGLPAVGTTLQPGSVVAWINNLPTYLFAGAVPAWRAFEPDMSDGPDVAQLEANLASGGFLVGEAPDAHFDGDTSRAIERWQKVIGVEQTGSIALGEIIFRDGVLRVSKLDVALGDPVGAATKALEVTSLEREIRVKLGNAEVSAAHAGGAVRIGFEDSGDTFDGVVREVGARTKDEMTGESNYPVTIDAVDASGLPEGDDIRVSVTFLGEERDDVLFVPIGAITAIDSRTFGIQVLGQGGVVTTLPVTLGVAASGNIEISGDGISGGMTVLVAGS